MQDDGQLSPPDSGSSSNSDETPNGELSEQQPHGSDGLASEISGSPSEAAELDLRSIIDGLERIVAERGLLATLTREERARLYSAAGKVAHPSKSAKREFTRATRRERRKEQAAAKAKDEQLLATTGIRNPQSVRYVKAISSPRPFEPELPPPADRSSENFRGRLGSPRNCYTCKRDYDLVHFFYDSLCPDCAEFNWKKREQTADLSGRYALLTGGRVKIGFFAALKLLRSGAHVVVTTRFPRDAAERFVAEEDSSEWIERLQLHGLDLRHSPSVEAFASHLNETLPRLDFILNNACQTVRRPPQFYQHLMDNESQPLNALPESAQHTLESHQTLIDGKQVLFPVREQTPSAVASSLAGIEQSAQLSQVPLVSGDETTSQELFPQGKYDEDLQQVDLRAINSWRLKLADVPTVEILEVHLVNAVAPFILNARLKPLMLRVPSPDKHIVNVSAMEGVFYRAFKRDTHPHTNMAKAALNMMTRTSAQDYIKYGIHMNSVDTGWITDEDPADIAKWKQQELGFRTPLDHVDAAARICDPIFSGFNSGEHTWGKFLKDYQSSNW